MVKSLGADRVIDYTRDDFTKSVTIYDFILDAVGKASSSWFKGCMKEKEIYFNVNKDSDSGVGQKINDLVFLPDLVEAGKIKPVIDRHYSLAQIIEAHSYVDQVHKKGNVVIKVVP
jgi:NADPH:quinone reductase-like Zn-dependent oxidoreductase